MKDIFVKKLNELTGPQRNRLMGRSGIDFETLAKDVLPILDKVRTGKDKALYELTERFDKCRLKSLRVSEKEVREAVDGASGEICDTFRHIKKNLERYCLAEKSNDWFTWIEKGIYSGMIYRPFERIGVYVPGRKALFPTIALRICVPALIAGVKEIALCSPPDKEGKIPPGVLISADILGIKEIYKIGGAQAIAAMVYGTESVRPVQKISAVGSAYVIAAQKFLFGSVSIDKLAGPSDALVLADSTARPELVAANMLVETEHGPTSGTVVLVPSMVFAAKVKTNVKKLLADAPAKQREYFATSLYEYSAILVYDTLDEAVRFVNDYAPEHLQLTVDKHIDVINKLKNVGAIQVGEYSMISSADFFGGSSNVLPTGGMAKLFSDITVHDFLKKIPVQYFSKEGFESICDKAERLAEYQGMYYHAKAISIRKKI